MYSGLLNQYFALASPVCQLRQEQFRVVHVVEEGLESVDVGPSRQGHPARGLALLVLQDLAPGEEEDPKVHI